MRKVKFLFLFILTVMLMLGLSACLKEKSINRPVDQPFSKWISEDETICFETNENGAGYGTLTFGDEVFNIYFATGAGRAIDIYIMEEGEPNHLKLIERWQGDFRKDDMFIAIVSKTTTYYTKGDKIIFYRVDDDTPLP